MKNLILIFFALTNFAFAQIGGSSTFQFLDMPVSARATSQGGIYNHLYENDAGLAFGMPAMLNSAMHKQLAISYLPYFAGSHSANLNYIHDFKRATFQFGTQFMNYGKLIQYDELGTAQGLFNASDVALVAGAGHSYKDKFKFGANAKLAVSQIESYTALGMAFDLSAMFVDTAKLFSASLIIRNLGFQLKAYTKGNQELMPTDIQVGLSKRFKHLPFRINLTGHNFTRWDVRYNDPNAVQTTITIFDDDANDGPGGAAVFFDNFMRHIIIGGEFQFGKAFNMGFAYNYHRRAELALQSKGGLAGFSFGFGLKINRIGIQYGMGKYTNAGAANHLTMNINLGQQIKIKQAPVKDVE